MLVKLLLSSVIKLADNLKVGQLTYRIEIVNLDIMHRNANANQFIIGLWIITLKIVCLWFRKAKGSKTTTRVRARA